MGQAHFQVLVIASADWISAARLVPVLKGAGCEVTVVAPKGATLLKAGGVDRAVAGGESIEAILEAALELVADRQRPFDYIQIADDHLLWHLTERRHEARLHPIFPFDPSGEMAEVLTSKDRFTEYFAKTGLKVVPGCAVQGNEAAIDAAGRLGYPVILKPALGSGGVGVRLFEAREQLERELEQVPLDQPFVVQRFVRGRVGLVEFLMDRGEPICWTVWYKTRTILGPFGGSSARELLTLPEMEEQLRCFGRATRFHGFCGMDLIHEEGTGDFYFIEVNPRQTSGPLFGWAAGADFAKALAGMLQGQPRPQPPIAHRRDGLRVRAFPSDIERAIYSSDARALLTAPFDPALWRDIRSQDRRLLIQGCRVIWLEVKRKAGKILERLKRP